MPILEWWLNSSGLIFDYTSGLMAILGTLGKYKVMDWFVSKFGNKLKFDEDAINHLLNSRFYNDNIELGKKSLDWWIKYNEIYNVPLKYSYSKKCWWFTEAYTDPECEWKQFPAKKYKPPKPMY